MYRTIMTVVLTLALGLSVPLPSEAKLTGPKQRIAVTAFHDKSGQSFHYWHNVGDGMADMLATALQKTGKFIVLERNSLSDIKEEQALGRDGAVQSATAAKTGMLIGAGYIVTGSISEFGIKNSVIGAGKLGTLLPFGGSASLHSETARVALDLRFVDTTTGQVVKTEKAIGTKTSRKVESDLDILPSVEFGKEGFDETVIGQATREAIEEEVKMVEKHLQESPWHGRIVKVEGGKLYINSGEEDGRIPGDTFTVVRAGETMLDPDTGESLGAETAKLGQIRIVTIIGKRLARAEMVGHFDSKVGDIIE